MRNKQLQFVQSATALWNNTTPLSLLSRSSKMNHPDYENRNELSRERKLSRNMRNALPLSKSLAIFGYTCWKELETGM